MMDVRLRKLKIELPSHWVDISNENPDGPPSFIDGELEEPGVLQISLAEYVSGEKPNVTHENLLQLSRKIGYRNNFGQIKASKVGGCSFGKYACVQFARPDFLHVSVWHLTNGKDFILSTFICSVLPSIKGLSEVENILMSIKKKPLLFY